MYIYIYVQYRPGFICVCPYIYIYQKNIFPTKVSQGAAGHFDAHYDVSGRLKHLTASSGYEFLEVQVKSVEPIGFPLINHWFPLIRPY